MIFGKENVANLPFGAHSSDSFQVPHRTPEGCSQAWRQVADLSIKRYRADVVQGMQLLHVVPSSFDIIRFLAFLPWGGVEHDSDCAQAPRP